MSGQEGPAAAGKKRGRKKKQPPALAPADVEALAAAGVRVLDARCASAGASLASASEPDGTVGGAAGGVARGESRGARPRAEAEEEPSDGEGGGGVGPEEEDGEEEDGGWDLDELESLRAMGLPTAFGARLYISSHPAPLPSKRRGAADVQRGTGNGETVAIREDECREVAAAAQAATAAEHEWHAAWDARFAAWYYYCEGLGVTQWVPPPAGTPLVLDGAGWEDAGPGEQAPQGAAVAPLSDAPQPAAPGGSGSAGENGAVAQQQQKQQHDMELARLPAGSAGSVDAGKEVSMLDPTSEEQQQQELGQPLRGLPEGRGTHIRFSVEEAEEAEEEEGVEGKGASGREAQAPGVAANGSPPQLLVSIIALYRRPLHICVRFCTAFNYSIPSPSPSPFPTQSPCRNASCTNTGTSGAASSTASTTAWRSIATVGSPSPQRP